MNPVELIYDGARGCVADKKTCGKAKFKTPWETADDATDYVKGIANGAFLEGVGGSDCTIDIVVGNDSFISDGAEAAYLPSMDAIVIGEPYSTKPPENIKDRYPAEYGEVSAHELFHAVIELGGDMEAGLVRSMEVLYADGSAWEDYDFQNDQTFSRGAKTIEVVGNAMYRIYGKIKNKKKVFELALRTAGEQPADLDEFQTALDEAADDMEDTSLQAAIQSVLTAMKPPERLLGGEPAGWREARKEAQRQANKLPGDWQDDEDDDSEARPRSDGRQDDKEDDSEDKAAPGGG